LRLARLAAIFILLFLMISKEEALLLYRKLLLARLSEEKIRELYPQNDIKTPVHLGIGGEAIPIGVCHCLPQGTKFFGTYRNHTLYLALSENTDVFFAELYGKVTGAGKGKAGSMHLTDPEHGLVATSAVVGTTIPVAVGAALANQYHETQNPSSFAKASADRKSKIQNPKWVVAFFGDGAMEEGAFWESLNFACLRRLRILFVCEDNGLAIHSPADDRRGFRSVLEATRGFDCHGASAEGADLSLVIQQTREMMEQMSKTPKPGFLHFTYFRFLEHVGPNEDFDAGYRKGLTTEERAKADPVAVFASHLPSLGCSHAELKAIESEVKSQIDRSVKKAQTDPFPSASELYTDVMI